MIHNKLKEGILQIMLNDYNLLFPVNIIKSGLTHKFVSKWHDKCHPQKETPSLALI